MNYKVFLQRLPKTEDEAFLLNHDYIKPFRIVCEESEVLDVAGHLINTIPNKDSNNIRGLLEQCYCRSFEEYDPFYEHSQGRRFIFCSESWLPNAGGGQLNFSLCPELSAPQETPNCPLANDKRVVYQILMRRDMDDRAKAQSLLTLLLDRQMTMDDMDYCAETDAARLSSAASAEFFDRTMNIIRELSPEVHKTNIDQITLPSIQDFVDRYK